MTPKNKAANMEIISNTTGDYTSDNFSHPDALDVLPNRSDIPPMISGHVLSWMSKYRTNRHWQPFFQQEMIQDMLNNIESHISHQDICPHIKDVFKVFKMTNPNNIKVVILGMDPYQSRVNGENRANGIAFSTSLSGIPQSLGNIFKEIMACGYQPPPTADLSCLLKQGVFLVNSALTVRYDESGSHNRLWKGFTLELLRWIVSHCSDRGYECPFMLWGKKAEGVAISAKINLEKESVWRTSHPSPYSARRGFIGCKHFLKCNEYLVKVGKREIDWSGGGQQSVTR